MHTLNEQDACQPERLFPLCCFSGGVWRAPAEFTFRRIAVFTRGREVKICDVAILSCRDGVWHCDSGGLIRSLEIPDLAAQVLRPPFDVSRCFFGMACFASDISDRKLQDAD